MNLFMCTIVSANNTYSQKVYSEMGDVVEDRDSVLLGFKDRLPVLKTAPVKGRKDLPVKKTIKVEVDPSTGDKFIQLNGKKLRVVPEAEIRSHIKKVNALKAHSPDIRTSNCSKLLSKMPAKRESLVHPILNKTDLARLSGNQLITDSNLKVINVKTPLVKTTDKNVCLIKQDKVRSFNNSLSNNSNQIKLVKISNKMKALDLTKQQVDQSIQTEKEVKEASIQTEEVEPEKPFEELFNMNFDDLLTKDCFLPLPLDDIFHPGVGLVQNEKQKHQAARFFGDMRAALFPDDKGNMPIHVGILRNDLKMVKQSFVILKALNRSVDFQNNNGYTSLQLAVIHGSHTNIVTFLLEKGARLDVCDEDGKNIIHLAVEYQRTYALPALLDFASQDRVLDQFSHGGLTPLMICALNGQHKCAEILLDYEAEINTRDQISGRTALFHAAECQDLAMVELLLQYQADTKIKNFFGTSPHDAMYEVDEMPEKIKMLILGKVLKRKMADDAARPSSKLKRRAERRGELKTYARLEKIKEASVVEDFQKNTIFQDHHFA